MKNYFYTASLFIVIIGLAIVNTSPKDVNPGLVTYLFQMHNESIPKSEGYDLDSANANTKSATLSIPKDGFNRPPTSSDQDGMPTLVPSMKIHIGKGAHLLTGPWRFHTGDNIRWAAPEFNDVQWKSIDLTPDPGAHDGDVGLTDYVPGWWSHGYEGYTGYAWYRLHISFDVPSGIPMALLAPPYVDDAYQLYWNGILIGESGDFSGKTPVIYSTRPQIFRLPLEAINSHDAVIAIRVWMRSGLSRLPDAGGIHIPPMLGTRDAIHAQYQLDWLETFKGYVIEVIEPLAFLLLALLIWCFRAAISNRRFVYWLCTALLLTAAYRLNQAVYTWLSIENLTVYLNVHRILIPLGLASWIMAWRHWYQLERWRWLTYGIGIITLLSVILIFTMPHNMFSMWRPLWRIPLAIVLLATAVLALRKPKPDKLLTFITVLFVAASQFSGALTALGVPGIWFPFGTGVSLTQYLYVGIIVGLAVMLIRIVQRALKRSHNHHKKRLI